MFEKFSPIPPDPILKLIAEHNNDVRANKIDLGVGVYRDASGVTPIMKVVKVAEEYLLNKQKSKAYIGLAGDTAFNQAMQDLVIDQSVTDDSHVTIQTAGGSTSLRVAIELMKRSSNKVSVWVSEPTWNNHIPILESVGIGIQKYPYYDDKKNIIDFDAMMECLKKIPTGDVILLHACCHNPTGMDPTHEQWSEIAKIIAKRGIIPFIDNAYQGLANGLSEDAFAVKIMKENVSEMLISSSCSKNFGLYRDRSGTLTIISKFSFFFIISYASAILSVPVGCSELVIIKLNPNLSQVSAILLSSVAI